MNQSEACKELSDLEKFAGWHPVMASEFLRICCGLGQPQNYFNHNNIIAVCEGKFRGR